MHWSDVGWVSSGLRKNSSGETSLLPPTTEQEGTEKREPDSSRRHTGQEARLQYRKLPSLKRQNYYNDEAGQIPEWRG